MISKRILFLTQASAITRIFPQLREAEIEVSLAENAKGASAFVRASCPQYIISRPSLAGYQAEELFAEMQSKPNYPKIIILAEDGTADEARYFMDMGAYDYWIGPLVVEKIIALSDTNTLSSKKTANISEKSFAPKIVGSSLAVRRVLSLAKQIAPSKATVLINGESGTGKEMFAKNLHAWSDRASAPFIAINCAALPEHLLESELFGHEKGSFTGAIAKKIGKFELASGGTLLLDEISEMDIVLQAKLLRALQEGEIDRVGGAEAVKVNVRIIATTNRNLEEWVSAGKFRQDLYFRLNVIPLRLPSLRERGDDVFELAHFFINTYIKEYKLSPVGFSPEAIEWLKKYDWPGNVRELQNLMERAVLLAAGKDILPAHFLLDPDNWPLFEDDDYDLSPLDDELDADTAFDNHSIKGNVFSEKFPSTNSRAESSRAEGSRAESSRAESLGAEETIEKTSPAINSSNGIHSQEKVSNAKEAETDNLSASCGDEFSGALMPLHEVERLMIKKGLAVTSGNRTQAAELLAISVRTLRNKLNEYKRLGLDVE